MIMHMALKGISPAIPIDVLQKVQSFLRDRTMIHLILMIANKSLESSTSVLTKGERVDYRLHGCPTISFFDLHIDRIIIILEDRPDAWQARL